MSSLALGTAQFGLDYGINNKRGRIPKDEVFAILQYAWEKGVRVLDTAFAYKDSEKVIGEFIQKHKKNFKVVSKLPWEYEKDVQKGFEMSLKNLQLKKIYGYLVHHFKSFTDDKNIWETFKRLKEEGKVEKIGFSLYKTEDLEYLLEQNIAFDIAQVPLSVLDQRFVPFLSRLKEKSIEVHVRSVFLQGLVFKTPNELTGRFKKIKDKAASLRSLAAEHGIPLPAICLNFVLDRPDVDEAIIGIDSLKNLEENVQAMKFRVKDLLPRLAGLKEEDENIILPTNWK